MIKIVLLKLFLFNFITSCNISSSNVSDDYPSTPPKMHEQKSYANGVKLIASNISDPRDESTIGQETYMLNNNRRLLVRLQSHGEKAQAAVVNDEYKMYFALSADEFALDKKPFETKLKVCPITSNWMMLATWTRAHTLPTASAKWSKAGGDFSENDCVTADLSYEDAESDTLYFDVSNWYLYFVQAKGQNFGLMIQSGLELEVYGDADSIRTPRFVWLVK